MKVSPAGDTLTLTPSSAATGNVTNPNGSFCALVYGDKGWLKISATKDAPAVLPEGQWKLYGYTVERAEHDSDARRRKEPNSRRRRGRSGRSPLRR